MNFYLANIKGEVLFFNTKWLEMGVFLTKISEKEKDKHMITHFYVGYKEPKQRNSQLSSENKP